MIGRLLLPLLLLSLAPAGAQTTPFVPDIGANISRPWPGKDFWANPAEDWTLSKGRLENSFSGGNRNVTLLTAELTAAAEPFTVRASFDQVSFELFGDGFVGFQAGIRGESGDYREAAVTGTGFAAGIDFTGRPFLGGVKLDGAPLPLPLRGVVLELKGEPDGADGYKLSLLVEDATGKILRTVTAPAHASWLPGLVSLTASSQPAPAVNLATARPARLEPVPEARQGEGRFGFSKLAVSGAKFALHPERAFGPILWTTYTMDNDGTLCLLVQAAPFARNEKLDAELILPGRDPIVVTMEPISRTVRFRVLKLDPNKSMPY